MTGPSKAATAWRWAKLSDSNENEAAIGGRIQAGKRQRGESGLFDSSRGGGGVAGDEFIGERAVG
jgi:hypothetical protein